MQAHHYKLMICGQPSFRAVRDTLPTLEYEPGMQRGFLLSAESTQNRVKGRYIYTKIGKLAEIDPESLEVKETATESLAECVFEIDQQKGLAKVLQRRGELNALHEALDAIPGANVEFEDLNLNLLDLMLEVQGAYKKNVIKSLRIHDYLARENMLANASFKIIEPQDGEKIAEKFSDQLDAFTLTLKLPDGACALTVTRKGSVRASDDAPDELLSFVKDLLPRFHEAEVETAQVVDPVAAQRKRR
ncbi:MAG: hypothetical protein H6839_09775 [Planctomycetes bacterium]|nr:hypothetical protein [Planctomycetota bacterium]